MIKIARPWCALLAVLATTGGAFAHGHGGGGGGHMSIGHSSFHSLSFHSSPSFHSISSPHLMPSFHSSSFSSSPSFHSSSFGPSSSIHPSSFESTNFDRMKHTSSVYFPDHTSYGQSGVNGDPTQSHHHGFLFFGGGHRSHNNAESFANGGQGITSFPHGEMQNLGVMPRMSGGQNVNTLSSTPQHHGGFLFFGHHHHDQMVDANGNALAYSHHPHYSYSNFNSTIYSSQLPPSGMVINMATPPTVQPVPINLSVAKYFYRPSIRTYYNPAHYYGSYTTYNPGNFGYYGRTYSGYGYSPTGGMTYLFFRLLSMLGLGRSYYGYGSTANYGYIPGAFLGTWGPASSLAGSDMDQNPDATNFVNNYENFNYAGGQVAPFANLSSNNGTTDDGTADSIYGENGDSQQGQDQQGFMAQGSRYAPQNLTAMLGPNAAATGYQRTSEACKAQDAAKSNSDADRSAPGLIGASEQPEFGQVSPQTFQYHNRGVLGSAFTHSRALPSGSYKAPELLGIIFTHQFWDWQNQAKSGDDEQTDSMTAQN